MAETLGQRIKKLRRMRNLTQEELAELLCVTAQAVSKWENEICMPDVSLIVPLARVFEVSTDLLLGVGGENEEEDVRSILAEATAQPGYAGYRSLEQGLKKYPCSLPLLIAALERSIALSYPENDCCDREHAREIYEKSERIARLIIEYAPNASDVLRARSIMVILHASYGEPTKAARHLPHFPCRADMTEHNMAAHIAHAEGDFARELFHREWEFLYIFESMPDCLARGGIACIALGRYSEAIRVLRMASDILDVVYAEEALPPPTHQRDCGDIYELLAQAHLLNREPAAAVHWLERLFSDRLSTASDGWSLAHTPLLCDLPIRRHQPRSSREQVLHFMENLLDREPFCSWTDDPLMQAFRKKWLSA